VDSLSPNDDITPKPNNKLIHLVRHAQGFHNQSYKKHSLRDPLLTPKGLTQCGHVSTTFPAAQQSSIKLLAASPLRRTIYTALYSFPDVVKRGLKIVALPEAQENGALPCDIGSDPEALEKEFEALPVDLSLVHEGWNSKTGRGATDADAIRERALFVRRWLRDREEDVICLVSHGGFLHYLNEDWDGFGEAKGTGWVNCEWRTYEFKAAAGEGDENATLVETEGSRTRRRGTEK
jgi:broad specificity phosphatase PhoE